MRGVNMNVVIRKSNMANGAYTFNYLNNMRNCKFKFIRANGKSIAIQHNGQLDNMQIPVITIIEERKVPLWKQSMQLQTGRIPRQTVEDRRRYRTEQLKENQLNRYRFEVYELCMY